MTIRIAHIGRDLQSRLKRFFDAPPGADATPLEICQAVLDDVEGRLQPAGRGRKVFPYTRLVVRVLQTGSDRAAMEAAFAGLAARVRERLAEVQCDAPRPFDVKIVLLRKPPPDWPQDRIFRVDYRADQESPAAPGTSDRQPPVLITIVKGAAARKAYSLEDPVISIGRTASPTGEHGCVRRNRIVFLDRVDGITETVGRAHAQLRFDRQSREYRLFDDGSSNGTVLVRDGVTIPVPPRDPRGVRVCSGDEVHLGRAIVRVVMGA